MQQEHMEQQEPSRTAVPAEEERASLPLADKLTCGVSTFLAAGVVDLVAHFGPTGLVVGGIAAYVASQHGPELLEQVRGARPARPALTAREAPRTLTTEKRTASQRSMLDRALGRFPTESSYQQDDDDDTVIVSESDLPAHEAWGERWRPAASHRHAALLDLAPDVRVPVRDLAGKAIFVCGIRRQGKTTLGALLAEQLGKHSLPLVIPDLEGDYLSLAEVLPRAVIAGHSRAAGGYPTLQFAPIDTVQAAYQLGYETLECGYQVILDLASYTTLDEALAVQINVIRGLFHWTSTHPENRVPCHVYLDEAQRYLPQNLSDSVILNRTVLGMLLKCYMDILAIGGKRGLAPVILTQRFAQVNNKIMAQSEVFFLLRQTHDTDLKRCMEYVNSEIASREQIATFQPGQGVYIASDGSQIVTHFDSRRSSGERSASPQPEAAARYAQMPRYRPQAQEAAEEREAVPSADQSSRRITVAPQAAQPEPTALERAIRAYLDGAISQPKLAAALKISPWEARKLMPEVEAAVKCLQADEQ